MKILQRYVLRELGLPFLLCLVVLNFIFMAGYLTKAANFIIGRGVPLTDTLYVLLLALPEMVSYTVPMSLLTCVLIVFGNLSQNNEVRAVKASGIHLMHIIWPAFLIGILLSFFMLIFNDQITTNAAFLLRRTTKQMMIKHPHALIEPGRFVRLSDNTIFLAKEFDGKWMQDIVIYEVADSNQPVRTIIAESGELVPASGNTQMKIKLYNGSISDAEDKGVQAVHFKVYEFSTMGEEDIRKMQKKKKDFSLAEILIQLQRGVNSEKDRLELNSAFHERIAFACGSFIFVFVGIPLAILVRRGEIVLSFALSLAMACLYYILFVGAKTLSVEGIMPPVIAFWIPNLILFCLGGFLLRKALIY